MPDIIQITWKQVFDEGNILGEVKALAEKVNKAIKDGFKGLEGSDIFKSIIVGLNTLKTSTQDVTKETQKTGETLQRQFKESQADAEKLSKVIKGSGADYSRLFTATNQFLGGLRVGDIVDIMEALKRQFAFIEKSTIFSKQITETTTMTKMIEQLYEAVARYNASIGASAKIGLPEMEMKLLEAIRESATYADQVTATERVREAILLKNVALEAEQALMISKQGSELLQIDQIEMNRLTMMERMRGMLSQMDTLWTSLSMLQDQFRVGLITGGIENLRNVYSQVEAISLNQLATEQQIAEANSLLVSYKNQILQIANTIGISYDKELKNETEILRLYQMKQQMIQASLTPLQIFLMMVEKIGLAMQAITWTGWGRFSFIIPTGLTEMEGMLLSIQNRLVSIQDKFNAIMGILTNANVPLLTTTLTYLDAMRLQLEYIQSQFKGISAGIPIQMGWTSAAWAGGAGGGGGGIPTGTMPTPNTEAWDMFEASIRRLLLASQELYQQLQLIATTSAVKGDFFDAITASAKALEAEIDRAIKSLSILSNVEMGQLATDIMALRVQAQDLNQSFVSLTTEEMRLNGQLNAGTITEEQYAQAMSEIIAKQAMLRQSAIELQGKLATAFTSLKTQTVQQEYAQLEARLRTLGSTAIEASAKVEVLKRMMALLKEQIILNGDSTGQLNTQYKDLAKQFQTAEKEVSNTESGLKRYGMTLQNLIKWQVQWYLGSMLIWQAFFKIRDIITTAISYTKELDDARVGILRWGATSGQVTDKMRKDADDMVIAMRQVALQVPITFTKLREGAEAFIGAGLDVKLVEANLKNIAILMSSFPEISMNQFAIAITGTMKVFNVSMQEIIEQLLKAQELSIIRPEQFTQVLQYMSEMGKASGFTLTQILAMAAGLADTGMQANRLGRLTASMWAAMVSDKAIKMFQSIGIEIDKNRSLAEQFFPVLDKLKKALGMEGGAISAGAMNFISKMFTKDQLKDVVGLMDKLDVIRQYIDDIGKSTSSLEKLNKLKVASITGQWELLGQVFKELSGNTLVSVALLQGFVNTLHDIGMGMLAASDNATLLGVKVTELGNAGKAIYTLITAIKTLTDNINGARDALILFLAVAFAPTIIGWVGAIGTWIVSLGQATVAVIASTFALNTLTPALIAAQAAAIGLAGGLGYLAGVNLDKLIYQLTGIDLSGLNKPAEATAQALKETAKNTDLLNKALKDLGITGINTFADLERAQKAGQVVFDQTLQKWVEVKKKTGAGAFTAPPDDKVLRLAESLRRLKDDWADFFAKTTSIGTDTLAVLEVQNKYRDILNRAADLFGKLKLQLPKEEVAKYKAQFDELKAYVAQVEPIEVEIAKINLKKTYEDIKESQNIISDLTKTDKQWSDAFTFGIDEVHKKYSDLLKILEENPDMPTGEYDKIVAELNRLASEGDRFAQHFLSQMAKVGKIRLDLKVDIQTEKLQLMPEGIEKSIEEIDRTFNQKLKTSLETWQKGGLISDIGVNIDEVFKQIIESGKPAIEIIKQVLGAKATPETIAAMEKWINYWQKGLDLQKELAEISAKYKVRTDLLTLQQEQNKLLSDAYELNGQLNESKQVQIDLLKQEYELKKLSYQEEIDKAQAMIDLGEGNKKDLEAKIDAYKKLLLILEKFYNIKITIETKELTDPVYAALDDINKKWKTTWKDIYKFTQDMAENIRSTLSDVIFDGLTGKMKSFREYYLSFWNSLARQIADVWSKQIMNIFIGEKGEGIFGRFISSITEGVFGISGKKEEKQIWSESNPLPVKVMEGLGIGGIPATGYGKEYAINLIPEMSKIPATGYGEEYQVNILEEQKKLIPEMQTGFKDTQTELKTGSSGILNAIAKGFLGIANSLANIVSSIFGGAGAGGLSNLASEIIGLFGSSTGTPSLIEGTPGVNYTPLEPINYTPMQIGGWVEKLRPYIVGEKGAELFVPRQTGQIISNQEIISNIRNNNSVNNIGGQSLMVSVPITVPFDNKKMISELRAETEKTVINIIRKYN